MTTQQDKKEDFYSKAHLVVAAIRVFEHLHARPPGVDDLSKTINISIEQSNFVCRKLEELGVIEAVEGSYGARLFILDHLKIEEIPRGEVQCVSGRQCEMPYPTGYRTSGRQNALRCIPHLPLWRISEHAGSGAIHEIQFS